MYIPRDLMMLMAVFVRQQARTAFAACAPSYTVGFHNFNVMFIYKLFFEFSIYSSKFMFMFLRTFNLRVSNPSKLIADVCLTRRRISMCQGLGPKKDYEISEIDRSYTIYSYYVILHSMILIVYYVIVY